MITSAPRAVHRLITFAWCLVMVSVLGLGSRASAREPVVELGASELRQAPEPDSQFGLPPATSDLVEDAESEKSSGGDDDVSTESRWALELSSGLLAAVRVSALALRSSQAFERRQHNRGPPV